jgi:serpin B
MKPRERRSSSPALSWINVHPRLTPSATRILTIIVTVACYFVVLSNCQVSFGMRKLAYSTNQFGLDLMRAMDRSDENMAFCPFCISSSLAMMLSGAQGSTATSLRHALYLWGMQTNEINVAFYDLMTHLGVNLPNERAYRRSGLFAAGTMPQSIIPSLAFGSLNNASHPENDVSFLTNVYVQRDFPIDYHYHMLLQRFYKTAIHPLDFHFNGEETRQHINAIVEKQTNGKIRDILPDRQSPATQLLLLSALYFQGTLDIGMSVTPKTRQHLPIPPPPGMPVMALTRPSSVVFGEDHVMLESHNAKIRYRFDRYLNSTAIEMPFKGGLITLVLLMPADPNGLEMLLTRLSAQVLADVVNSLEVRRVNVRVCIHRSCYHYLTCQVPWKRHDTRSHEHFLSFPCECVPQMPELSVKRGNSNLTWALSSLGLADLFKPGFAQLYDISDYKWLSVSGIIHKTHFDIRESGERVVSTPAPVASNNIVKNPLFSHPSMKPPVASPNGMKQPVAPDADITTISIDKPFLYFVFDNVSGLIMVMGKYGREPVNYRLPISSYDPETGMRA